MKRQRVESSSNTSCKSSSAPSSSTPTMEVSAEHHNRFVSTNDVGRRQLLAFLELLEKQQLYHTQGKGWSSRRVSDNDLLSFLSTKLRDSRKNSEERNPFLYLDQHCIASTDADVKRIRKELLTQCKCCRIVPSYRQLRLPTSEKPVTASDAKNGKEIGILQIQCYIVDELLTLASSDAVELESSPHATLVKTIRSVLHTIESKIVGAHLCKAICLQQGHVTLTTSSVHRKQDYCPGIWIVAGKMINFCQCMDSNSTTIQCMRPGRLFQVQPFKECLEQCVLR